MPLAAGYFDESSDEGIEDRSYCVAGFVGNGAAALELDMRWGDLLKKFDLDYFKSSEIEFGFGQFAKHRDDPLRLTDPLTSNEKALIREIKTAFIDLICECEEMIGIGCVLLIRDYELLRSESPHAAKVLPVPYVLCANLALLEAGNMANEANQSIPMQRLSGRSLILTGSTALVFLLLLIHTVATTQFPPGISCLPTMKLNKTIAVCRPPTAWPTKLGDYSSMTNTNPIAKSVSP